MSTFIEKAEEYLKGKKLLNENDKSGSYKINEIDIEKMIDSGSLEGLLDVIFKVCGEKAEHLRSNWQDEQSAKVWDKAAGIIDTANAKINNLGI